MDILLITPCSDRMMAERSLMCPPPGLVRLCSYLNAKGHSAEYYDTNLYEITGTGVTLEDKLRERPWGIVGVSCLEDTLPADIANMQLARRLCPDAILVSGGMEAQFNYQPILDKSPCRIVVLGEGEIPLLMLANGEPLHTIPGIIFKNPAKPLTQAQFEEATASIVWEEVPYEKYWDIYVDKLGDQMTDERSQEIHTARVFSRNRCPIGCKFCTSTNQLTWGSGHKVPVIGASDDLLVDIIDRIVRSHPRVRTVYLTDDDFCINRLNAIRFCKKIVERDLSHLSFMCFSRITDLTAELLEWMAKAGFRRLNIGVESFSQHVLDELGKRCDAEVIDRNLALCKTYNVQPYMNVMLVTPASRLEDIELTLDKTACYIQDDFYRAGVHLGVKPLFGSELRETTCNFKTFLREIPDSPHLLKRDEVIYATDLPARQAQILYYENVDAEIAHWSAKAGLRHSGPQTVAAIKLNLMKKCIDHVRQAHGFPAKVWVSGPANMEGVVPGGELKSSTDVLSLHAVN